MRPRALLTLLLWLSACVGPAPGSEALPAGPSVEVFRLEAGPLLEKRCGDASCHGVADRPFALYASGRRRAALSDTFLNTPLTAAEVDANLDAVLGFLETPAARDSTLLQKALGAQGHGGGSVFAHVTDPEFRALERAFSEAEAGDPSGRTTSD